MREHLKFYIDGVWTDPVTRAPLDVIDPATEVAFARISMGAKADVDQAVAAARRAFATFSRTRPEERLALLRKIVAVYRRRYDEIATAISREVGAPLTLARGPQTGAGLGHLNQMIEILRDYPFETVRSGTAIVKEPIGVCGLITPWNWPINQIVCKVAPALAAGCTMVLKPSEVAPINAMLFAEILDEAGVPPGVFNLVNGGAEVGEAMSAHPDIDMMSFTGSTRAGVAVAKAAADTVKRVAQELGGKSANIILDDADIAVAVASGVRQCFSNSGQSCNAPTRMLVPRERQALAMEVARATADTIVVGMPETEGVTMGPVVSQLQYDRIQALIRVGIDEGATVVVGGLGRSPGLNRGYFVRPTVFADVTPDMTIAREEVFGPVLAILPYDSEAEAIRIANDTVYGLSAYVQSGDLIRARRVAARLRAGDVRLNGAGGDLAAPFGGFKRSGNGREWGEYGLEEFLEVKAVLGYSERVA